MRGTILVLALLATPALAEPNAAATRTVAFELRQDDQVIAHPTMTVRLGERASLAVGGAQGYALSFVVDQTAADAPYFVRTGLYRPAANGGWRLVASPSLAVAQGEQARVTMAAPSGPGYSLAVSIQ